MVSQYEHDGAVLDVLSDEHDPKAMAACVHQQVHALAADLDVHHTVTLAGILAQALPITTRLTMCRITMRSMRTTGVRQAPSPVQRSRTSACPRNTAARRAGTAIPRRLDDTGEDGL
jgi:hypothetical protein